MVSFINSVFGYFGSGVDGPGNGIRLAESWLRVHLGGEHPNTVAPGKRPFHTIIPAFVTRDGRGGEEPWLAFGVMGGAMQPQGHVQVLLNLIEFGMDLQEAVDAARFRHLDGKRVVFEGPVGEAVRARLRAMGHEVPDQVSDYGGAQAVMKLPRGWAAASDPRKDGHAAGH
jgi:gamma-glutamyltranspeptidase / glutathione hydrolase